MKLKTLDYHSFAVAAVICLCATPTAYAVNWGTLFCFDWCWPDCIRKTCCDDYAAKPMPCVAKVHCFGCDDYCPKCPPVTKKVCCFGCDDYGPKCPPVIQCAPCDHLTCVPTSDPCWTGREASVMQPTQMSLRQDLPERRTDDERGSRGPVQPRRPNTAGR